ncbi:MAG: PilZ domain-containing protein [Candidatus Omnitrophica bacterium]|nr:PilZ domain-containing protein [Candidatus Omnitrophota bacterium]
MDERRQIPRWEINQEAKIRMPQMQGTSRCVIEDMHLKGMRVSCDQQLFYQQEVSMSIAMDDNLDFIKINAHIPWEKKEQGRHVYGLSFDNMDDHDKDKIYQYISTNCYDQFKNKWWA